MTIGTITTAVSTGIAEAVPSIGEALVAEMVKRETAKRSALVIQGYDKWTEEKRRLNKFKPDVVTYNADGSKASETWSKKVLADKNTAEAYFSRLTKALEMAIETGSMDELNKCLQDTWF